MLGMCSALNNCQLNKLVVVFDSVWIFQFTFPTWSLYFPLERMEEEEQLKAHKPVIR